MPRSPADHFAPVNSIDRLRENNLSGGCKILLVPVDQVTSVPPERLGVVETAVVLAGAGTWSEVLPTRWTQDFKEDWVVKDGLRSAVASLEFIVPKDRVILLDDLWQAGFGRYIVLHYDLNGTIKILGTKKEPAMVRVEQIAHGTQIGKDRNQYKLLVEWNVRRPVPFYLAEPPVADVPATCETLEELIYQSTGPTIWGYMSYLQRVGALEAVDGDELWAVMSTAQQTAAVNSETGSTVFALFTTLHQVQAVNSLTMSVLWAMLNTPNQDALLLAAGAAIIATVDGTTLWGMLDGTQQAAVLAAAGITTVTRINNSGPPYTDIIIDPTP